MLPTALLLFASAALTTAAPVIDRSTGPSCEASHQAPALPKTGGVSELPDPDSGLTLKHIALGFGIQNYTCSQVGTSSTAAGALAMLYDITNLYPNQGGDSLSQKDFENLTSKALWTHPVPLRMNHNAPGASRTNPFPRDAPLRLKGTRPLPFLGHHYFDAAGVPTFDLDGGKIHLPCTKISQVNPPSGADAGPEGTGAVTWLYLGGNAGAIGAKYVYRVLTAGGVSHGCKTTGTDSTSYTATYWFYG
ncbi:malate dehydrogenase [Purpureocillium lavendulum]|uniref:Malate dehydrogenase n=1 Tax=Purpureocillium lavendulum TaxID=1247861 RepID=A0AB34FEC2_9HYPO|nr:malate dehydrogenase [Purpureocillium lavendulum]